MAMDPTSVSMPGSLLHIERLPQPVPSHVCLRCEVCCRFPEVDSFLRPYFTGEEISQAIAGGVDADAFPDLDGSQVRVVPNPMGEGYLCPAFDPTTSKCRIYETRPLDCRIYPLAVMWSADHNQVVLGWDTKCPFMLDRGGAGLVEAGHPDSIEAHAERVADILEEEPVLSTYRDHPCLIGRYQDDVVVVRTLPRLTAILVAPPAPAVPSADAGEVRRLTPNDYARFQEALAPMETSLAAYSLAPHLVWRELFTYSWMEWDQHLCVFAEYADGVFMPLPPLGPGPLREPLARAWTYMRQRNRGSDVSRVENVPEEWKLQWESWGYRLRPKDPDYLYDARSLAELRGDPYKSHRAACNRFARTHHPRYVPFEARDREPSLDLYRRWAIQKNTRHVDPVASFMLADSLGAHREAMDSLEALGLMGRVVWVDQALVAYTFGYFRSPSLFCVLLEVADRSLSGLASWIFRETCREAHERGAVFINTLDDSGLETLARSKRSYHPVRMIANYIATESEHFD